jgi:exodeoxyribonuclease V gamma subunit
MLAQWQGLRDAHARDAQRQPLNFEHAGVRVHDWLDGLRSNGEQIVWIDLTASRLADKPAKEGGESGKGKRASKPPELRLDKLVDAWVKLLLASACDRPVHGLLVGRHVGLKLAPLPREQAESALRDLIDAWRAGVESPLPLPLKTGLAQARELGTEQLITLYEGGFDGGGGEVVEPCLARLYPDFETLVADGRFEHYAAVLLRPLVEWAASHVGRLPSPGIDMTLDGAVAQHDGAAAGVTHD